MRLTGKGIQKVSGYGFGDHYVHIRIDVPKTWSDKQRVLLKVLTELESDTPGTVDGFTYDKEGRKLAMEDPDGLVAEIREVLEDSGNNKTSTQQNGSQKPD